MIHILLHVLLVTHRIEIGRATMYYPGDGFCGPIRADGRRFKATDTHIAHRRIPLGTKGIICSSRTHRCVNTAVRDRGPYAMVIRCGLAKRPYKRKIKILRKCHYWKAGIKLIKGWRWRGVFDLTRPVAKAIGLRSFDKVYFIYKKSIKLGMK